MVYIMQEDTIHLLQEICKEKSILCERLSYDFILKLTKNQKTKFITELAFDLNTQALTKILNDKYATYEVLKSFDIPIIEHQMIFNSEKSIWNENIWQQVSQIFHQYDQNVVVKPNNGSNGAEIFHCTTEKELKKSIDLLFQKHLSISICPFYTIKTEYRVIWLAGNIELIYGKIKPVFEWNGVSTVQELLEKFNPHFPKTKIFQKNIENCDMNFIPKKGEKVEFSWKFNLAWWAQVDLNISNFAKREIDKIVQKIVSHLEVKFVSIDIIQDEYDELRVIEINSHVYLQQFMYLVPNGKMIAKRIYAKAIDSMF